MTVNLDELYEQCMDTFNKGDYRNA